MKTSLYLSIIIPCYRSEKTIGYSLDSIGKSTFHDYEIVVVDSSEDELTKKAVKKFIGQGLPIRYFNLREKGTPYQVAFGIQNALGEFIGCVDSDDYIHPNMYSILSETQRKYSVDIVGCLLQQRNGYDSYPPNEVIPDVNTTLFLGNDYHRLIHAFYKHFHFFSRCLCIVRKEAIEKNIKVYQALTKNYWEDVIYDFIAVLGSASAALVNYPLYYYIHSNLHLPSRPITDPVAHIDYLISHQSIAESLFLQMKRPNDIGQTFWPLLRDYLYIIHRPSILQSRTTFFRFVNKVRWKMMRALWKMPLSMVPQKYDRKLICIFRFGLYGVWYLHYRFIRRKNNLSSAHSI